jgi:preprotein translocase subunit SecG
MPCSNGRILNLKKELHTVYRGPENSITCTTNVYVILFMLIIYVLNTFLWFSSYRNSMEDNETRRISGKEVIQGLRYPRT